MSTASSSAVVALSLVSLESSILFHSGIELSEFLLNVFLVVLSGIFLVSRVSSDEGGLLLFDLLDLFFHLIRVEWGADSNEGVLLHSHEVDFHGHIHGNAIRLLVLSALVLLLLLALHLASCFFTILLGRTNFKLFGGKHLVKLGFLSFLLLLLLKLNRNLGTILSQSGAFELGVAKADKEVTGSDLFLQGGASADGLILDGSSLLSVVSLKLSLTLLSAGDPVDVVDQILLLTVFESCFPVLVSGLFLLLETSLNLSVENCNFVTHFVEDVTLVALFVAVLVLLQLHLINLLALGVNERSFGLKFTKEGVLLGFELLHLGCDLNE